MMMMMIMMCVSVVVSNIKCIYRDFLLSPPCLKHRPLLFASMPQPSTRHGFLLLPPCFAHRPPLRAHLIPCSRQAFYAEGPFLFIDLSVSSSFPFSSYQSSSLLSYSPEFNAPSCLRFTYGVHSGHRVGPKSDTHVTLHTSPLPLGVYLFHAVFWRI